MSSVHVIYVYTASKRDQKQKTENKTFIVTKNYFNVREQKNDVKPERKFIRVNIGKCLFLFGWKIFRWICANSMCFSPSHSLLPFLCSFLFFLRAQTHAHEKGRRKEEKKKTHCEHSGNKNHAHAIYSTDFFSPTWNVIFSNHATHYF